MPSAWGKAAERGFNIAAKAGRREAALDCSRIAAAQRPASPHLAAFAQRGGSTCARKHEVGLDVTSAQQHTPPRPLWERAFRHDLVAQLASRMAERVRGDFRDAASPLIPHRPRRSAVVLSHKGRAGRSLRRHSKPQRTTSHRSWASSRGSMTLCGCRGLRYKLR